ncbi:MAG: hypothetical protein KTR30_05735 [Saprospiraceae bacterium]|nr:hypothetical protein [Saprospiraceae bacterium]
MKVQEDYSTSIQVKTTAGQAFKALSTEIDAWWGTSNRPADQLGIDFTVAWGEPWYQFKVVEYVEPNRITWACTDANQIIAGLEGVQKEWVGTQMQWTIREMPQGMVEITLLHQGLVPAFICYDFCSATWDSFVQEKLSSYLASEELNGNET